MQKYNQITLGKRQQIFHSQKTFFNFLDKYIINDLITLFNNSNNNAQIIQYLNHELQNAGISNLTIHSEVYGVKKHLPSLFLSVKKNNRELLHLSIHLSVTNLNPEDDGVIHIVKDIYKNTTTYKSKKQTKRYSKRLYAHIAVKQSTDTPNSLVFSIADGYTTYPLKNLILFNTIPTQNDMEPLLQKIMDAIINVLNKVFDENNKEYYIGNNRKKIRGHVVHDNSLIILHPNVNTVLENMNQHINHVARKNKGSLIIPYSNTLGSNNLGLIIKKSKTNRTTRKLRRINNSRKQSHTKHYFETNK